jgi:GntR family transcriptional regulator
VKKNGVGTFVSIPKHIISGRLEVDFSLTDSASAAGMSLQTVIASVTTREPTQREASKLNLKDDETVFYIQRMRYHDKKCIVLSFDVMPSRIFRDRKVPDIGSRSLYSLLEEECDCEIMMGEAVLSASFATQEYATIMDVEVGNPLMLVEQVDFNHTENPVLFSREYYNSRIFKFKINRRRNLDQHALEYLSAEQKG